MQKASDDVMDELNNRFKIIEINDLDDIISRIENMKVSNRADNAVINLVNEMSSLELVPNNHKLDVILEGAKKQRRKMFARKYKSVAGKKATFSKQQIDDLFNVMKAIKKEDDDDDMDMDFLDSELDQLGGGAKKSKKGKKSKKIKNERKWVAKVKAMKGGSTHKLSEKEHTKKLRTKIAKKKYAGKKKVSKK